MCLYKVEWLCMKEYRLDQQQAVLIKDDLHHWLALSYHPQDYYQVIHHWRCGWCRRGGFRGIKRLVQITHSSNNISKQIYCRVIEHEIEDTRRFSKKKKTRNRIRRDRKFPKIPNNIVPSNGAKNLPPW